LAARINCALRQSAEIPGNDALSDLHALRRALQGLASPADVRQWSAAMQPAPETVAGDWLAGGWAVVRAMPIHRHLQVITGLPIHPALRVGLELAGPAGLRPSLNILGGDLQR